MAKGASSKTEIQKKILEVFPGAFVADKIIRIPMKEDGEDIQIKVTLTAAKDILNPQPIVTPTAAAPSSEVPWDEDNSPMNPPEDPQSFEMTKEEKQKVANIMHKLNL